MTNIEAQIPESDHTPFATENLTGFNESKVASIERFPSLRVQSVLEENKGSMKNEMESIETTTFYQRLERAGELFATGKLGPGESSRAEYIEQVSQITGLPISSVEESIEIIEYCLKHIDEILTLYTPNGDPTVFDTRHYKRDGYSRNGASLLQHAIRRLVHRGRLSSAVTVGYVPKGRNLGVIAPSNHPAVMTLAMVAYATKYPLAIRPSDKEPFTPARLVAALHQAGVPQSSLVYLPGDRDVSDKILTQSDLGIGFGGPALQNRYANTNSVKIHGPGNSKVVIDAGWLTDDSVYDLLEEAMMRDGGRGCINASQIVTTGDASIIAERLAELVTDIELRSPLDSSARVPACVDTDQARQLNEKIEHGLQQSGARDVTAEYRDSDRFVITVTGFPIFSRRWSNLRRTIQTITIIRYSASTRSSMQP